MEAIAYCRISTQSQEEGVSLEMQKKRIEAWCLANDLKLACLYSETCSGSRANNRPQLQYALAHACTKKAVLVVYSLSRLARSVKDTLAIAERLEKANANLASLTERIDTSSALGKMVFRLLSTLNEFEKDQLAERTTSAMGFLRKAGKRISAHLPYGYDLSTDGVTLLKNAMEQETISQILLLSGKGHTPSSICRLLIQNKTPTKSHGHWYPSTVKGIIERQQKLSPNESATPSDTVYRNNCN